MNLRSWSVQGSLYLLDSCGDEVIYGVHRLEAQLWGGQAAHQYLECHCHQWTTPTRGLARFQEWWRSLIWQAGIPIRWDCEAWWEQWYVGCVFPAHCQVDCRQVHGTVDHNGSRWVYAALLKYQHVALACIKRLPENDMVLLMFLQSVEDDECTKLKRNTRCANWRTGQN